MVSSLEELDTASDLTQLYRPELWISLEWEFEPRLRSFCAFVMVVASSPPTWSASEEALTLES